jgi:hypothetical protein
MLAMPAVDPSKPAPYPPLDVVLIAVDVEAWEQNHSIITEVGIAVLDTRDIEGLALGYGGVNWINQIKARHLRIKENLSYVNSKYVNGDPERFEFGESEIVSSTQVADILTQIFLQQDSLEDEKGAQRSHQTPGGDDRNGKHVATKEIRSVGLVGHDAAADVRYLSRLGFKPNSQSTITKVFDIQHLYHALRCDQKNKQVSLDTVLTDLSIIGWNLHNAGNDAVYTMQALIGLCLVEAIIRKDSDGELDSIRSEEWRRRIFANRNN